MTNGITTEFNSESYLIVPFYEDNTTTCMESAASRTSLSTGNACLNTNAAEVQEWTDETILTTFDFAKNLSVKDLALEHLFAQNDCNDGQSAITV